jgi:uncharacterized protein
VHPETYPLVQKMLVSSGKPADAIGELMGRSDVLKKLRPEALADDKYGAITVKDVIAELDKPGRDPRPDFKVARFNEGVDDIKDLTEGMVLEGTVSNVAQFGAFVDLGVHQDGLVHVSQLSNKFVNDAREVVKTGDIVKVRVVEVDLARKRIALTMKLDAPAGKAAGGGARGDNSYRAPERGERQRGGGSGSGGGGGGGGGGQSAQGQSAMAAAFAKLQTKR